MSIRQRDFVKTAMAHLGLTPTELGTRLGKKNAYNSVNSWTTDVAKNYRRLSFEDTIAIASLCGWLNMSGAGPAIDKESPSAIDPLADLAAGVAALEKGQAKVIRLLQAAQAVQTSPPGDTPRRRDAK